MAEDSTSAQELQWAKFNDTIQELTRDQSRDLDNEARIFIQLLASAPDHDSPKWLTLLKGKELHRLLAAMIEHAPTKTGRRYATAAICACREGARSASVLASEGEALTLKNLQCLAEFWYSHFLWVSWPMPYMYGRETSPTPSEYATPTGKNAIGRTEDMRTRVLRRDAYRCAITGILSHSEFNGTRPQLVIKETFAVDNAYILKRAAVNVPNEEDSPAVRRSAAYAWDILKQYGALDEPNEGNTAALVDDPSNRIAMESHACISFEGFHFSLEPTTVPHHYIIKEYESCFSWTRPPHPTIVFQDHTPAWPVPPSKQSVARSIETSVDPDEPVEPAKPVALPNPKYLALHNALAGILHTSGAGSVLWQVDQNFKEDGRTALDRTAGAFEDKIIRHSELKESIATMLADVR
ncbi:hypothetical protein PLICRDRAFT_56854 [Plicaturopsis crispa FD-325 SS-3]|nr:hypothetical protein PLICRDRAFT_56854 [Plicaturopsis crispa FD-325 SS-3]